MVIRFRFANFKSYLDENTVLFTSSSKFRKLPNHETMINSLPVLKYLGIYGENATGKSTVVEALLLFKMFSCFNALPNDYNIAHKEHEAEPTSLSMTFSIGNEIYEYGFSIKRVDNNLNNFVLEDEFINVIGSGPRRGKEIYSKSKGINRTCIEDNNEQLITFLYNGYKQLSKNNKKVSFLVYMASDEHLIKGSILSETLLKIISYLKENIIVIGANTTNLNYVSKEFVDATNKYISKFDRGLEKVELTELEESSVLDIIPEVTRLNIINLLERQRGTKEGVVVSISNRNFIFVKKDKDKNYIYQTIAIKHRYIDTPFAFSEESEGTRKFILLMSYFASKNENKTFIIDELERSMHPCACDYLFDFFEKETAARNTQFVFTSHNTKFIKMRLRPDEIYYVDKDMYGGSIIYPQTDFKTLSSTNIEKNYIAGAYKKVS